MKKKKSQKLSASRRYLRAQALPWNCRWQWDFDYIDKLGPEDQEWLSQFVAEYYDGNFRNKKKLHATVEGERECYRRKNRQNKDLQSIMDCRGKMDRIDSQLTRREDFPRKGRHRK